MFDPRYRLWYADCVGRFLLASKSQHSKFGSNESRPDGYFSPTLMVALSEATNLLTKASVSYCKNMMVDSVSDFPVGVLSAFTQSDAISAAMRKAMKGGRGDAQSGEAYIVDMDGRLVTSSLCLSVSLCLTVPHSASPLYTGIECSAGFAGGCNVRRFLGVRKR